MDQTIWECLGKPSSEGILLSSCGAELQELMRQIDIMVRNKKSEWEAELTATQDCLSLKEQELSHTRALLEQKHQEVGILKHQLDGYESAQKSVSTQYETQLNKLRNQLKNLKDTHDKMQRSKDKKVQSFADKEKEMLDDIDRLTLDLKQKKVLVVQHEKEASEWDICKRSLQHQIEGLEKQKRVIALNYERSQQQLTVAQNRLKKSNRMVDEVEGTSQTLLRKLEEELANDKDLIQRQENVIADLQAKNRDLTTARHTATGEKYRYQEQSDKANCKLRVLEEEVDKLQASLSARETALRGSEHEIADMRNKIFELQASVQTKDKIIDAMQVRSPLKNKDDELQHKVVLLEASLEAMTEMEKQLRDEVQSLEKQLCNSKEEARNLRESLKKSENAKVNDLNQEINQLRDKLHQMEASHSAQLNGMKSEVGRLSTHLHGRDANIERLGATCAEMERQLRDESQQREKLNSELQSAASHLNKLRSQRQASTGDMSASTERSLTEAELQLTDLRQNYGKAVTRLEDENQHLKSQVSNLKGKLHKDEAALGKPYNSASTKDEENARINEIVRAYEHRIASLEARLQEDANHVTRIKLPASTSSVILRSADDSESATVTPRSDDLTPRSAVTDTSDGSKGVVRTPTPTKNFLRSIGIDPSSVNASSMSLYSNVPGSMSEKQLQMMLGISDEGFEDNVTPSSSLEDFAQQEEKRVVELESRIEKHIGDMQKAMDAVMSKYSKG